MVRGHRYSLTVDVTIEAEAMAELAAHLAENLDAARAALETYAATVGLAVKFKTWDATPSHGLVQYARLRKEGHLWMGEGSEVDERERRAKRMARKAEKAPQ